MPLSRCHAGLTASTRYGAAASVMTCTMPPYSCNVCAMSVDWHAAEGLFGAAFRGGGTGGGTGAATGAIPGLLPGRS